MESAEDSKYENSVIYKLVCSDGHYYYGSTTNYMNRLNIHKAHSILYPHTPLYKHIADIGWNNVSFEIIESFPCETIKELQIQEDTYIKSAMDKNDTLCLNKNRAHITEEERKQYHTVYNVLNAEKKIAYSKKYSEENKEKVLEGNRKYYEKNKEAILKNTNEYKEAHKEEYQLYKKAYYEENKEKYAEMARVRREENKEAIAEKSKEYYEENRDEILEKFKVYREKNKEKNKEYQKEYREANKAKQSEKHECSCGGVYTLNHKTIHENSKKHLLHMAQESV